MARGQHPSLRHGPEDRKAVRELTAGLPPEPRLLVEHLHRIQDARGHLPARLLSALAEHLRLTPAEVHETASFYHHFDVVPEGEAPPPAVTVRVCTSPACLLAGAVPLLEALRARLPAGEMRVVPAPCIGRCEGAPAVLAGRRPLTRAGAEAVAAAVRAGETEPEPPAYEALAAYRRRGGYRHLAALAAGTLAAETVLAELDASGLEGRGGAGFPTARKWRIVRAQPAPRTVVVNIDEGEPGTFKDRWILESAPHRMLEGALVAARVVEAERLVLYVRDEYAAGHAILARELEALRREPPAPLPALELRRGAGAYICGEESAMLESIEGRRGWPRLRPPYVAERGLEGRPTLVNNCETLYWVPEILDRGGAAFAARGRNGGRGLRLYSVSGRVRRPGVHEAPVGVTARELIEECAGGVADGRPLYAFLPGGAVSGILPAAAADAPLTRDGLAPWGASPGTGALTVLAEGDRARDVALAVMRFLADESCGQCTPCRAGTVRAAGLMAEACWDVETLEALCAVMAEASICGLGQAAPVPVRSVLRHFRHEVGTDT